MPHRVLVAERREQLVRETVAVEVVRDEVDVELGHFVGSFSRARSTSRCRLALRYQPPAAFVPPSTQSTGPVT